MKRNTIITLTVIFLGIFVVNSVFPAFFEPATEQATNRKSQLSIYSDDWNGLSSYRKELEELDYEISTVISNPLILNEVEHPEYSLYVCIGAEKGYDDLESEAVINFVNRGGNVIIADDFGDGNSLAKRLGVEYTGHRIWSRDYEYNLSFIKIEQEFDGEEYNFIMNEPTTLQKTGKTHNLFRTPNVLFTTSLESYEDTNDNGKIDSIGDQDIYGELTVGMEVESKGQAGSFIFLSDSSFCINDMWEMDMNSELSVALVEYLIGSAGVVIFDESRHIQESPLANSIYNLENVYIYLLLETDQVLGAIIALAFLNLFGLSYALTKHPLRFRHKFDLTYWQSYVEQAPDRLSDVRNILIKRLKANYNLYFPDGSQVNAYEPSTKMQYNLTVKSDLQALIDDPELVDFLLHPGKYNMADKLNTIVLQIDESFPLQEGMI